MDLSHFTSDVLPTLIGAPLIVVLIVIAAKSSKSFHKTEKEKAEKWKLAFSAIPDFNHDAQYVSKTGDAISFDNTKKKICFFDNSLKAHIYDYSKLLQCEIDIDGDTIMKQSTTGTVGRAVLGGILTGGVGAIIGGASASRTQKEKIHNIDLKVIVDDPMNPIYKINFFKGEMTKGSFVYKAVYPEIEKWHAILAGLIRQGSAS